MHIHWLMNGHSLNSPVMEYRQPLGQQVVLVSSWLQERSLVKDSHYQCVAEASTGSDTSEVNFQIPIRDEHFIASKYVNKWKSALAEHGQLLKKWEKTWENCDGH